MFRVHTPFVASLGLALAMLDAPVLAQNATPPPGEVIAAAECQVEPRPRDEIEELLAGVEEGDEAATPAMTEGATAEGEPADDATIQAVTETYRQLVACLNAGDYLRIYALYSDDYLRRTLGEREEEPETLLATPSPSEEGGTALVGVRDVRVIEGERVAARIETFDPSPGAITVTDAILVAEGDRFLIDAATVADVAEEATPVPGATPDGA